MHTERLVLRGFTHDDFEPFATIVSDPEVVRYLDDGAPISREDCWRGMALFIGHWHLRGYGWWAVEDRRSGEFLGRIGLYNPEGWPGIEVGWLLRRDAWGAGLATEGRHRGARLRVRRRRRRPRDQPHRCPQHPLDPGRREDR